MGTSYNYLILKGNKDLTRMNNKKSWSYDAAWTGWTVFHILLLAASTQLSWAWNPVQIWGMGRAVRKPLSDHQQEWWDLGYFCIVRPFKDGKGLEIFGCNALNRWDFSLTTSRIKHGVLHQQELYKICRLSQRFWKSYSYRGIKTVSSNEILQQCLL